MLLFEGCKGARENERRKPGTVDVPYSSGPRIIEETGCPAPQSLAHEDGTVFTGTPRTDSVVWITAAAR